MLSLRIKKYFAGLAIYCGTVIGVGLFALPYVASKAGFFPLLFYLVSLGFYSIISALIYGEMVERTKGVHRLPGYVGIYLKGKFKTLSLISGISGLSLALLAYMVVGGGFLAKLLHPYFGGQTTLYVLIFFLLGSMSIYFTVKTIARIEILMLVFFFLVVAILLIVSIPYQNMSYFTTFDPKFIFLPYGIVLFSLGGGAIIPEIKDLLGRKYEKLLKPVLITGTSIVVVTYLIFVISILGTTGPETTKDALGGIKRVLDGISPIFLIFGILTTFTSFITLGSTLKNIYRYDMRIPEFISWFFAVAVPLVLYVFGFTNFILIVSITGAIMGGFDNITSNLCYLKAKQRGDKRPSYSLNLSKHAVYATVGLFIIGIILELAALFWDTIT